MSTEDKNEEHLPPRFQRIFENLRNEIDGEDNNLLLTISAMETIAMELDELNVVGSTVMGFKSNLNSLSHSCDRIANSLQVIATVLEATYSPKG